MFSGPNLPNRRRTPTSLPIASFMQTPPCGFRISIRLWIPIANWAKLYPGETAYVQRLADLTRSLGHSDDKLYAESSKAWASMAEIYPTVREFRTKAGETLAEMGDFADAKSEWDKLLDKEQGNSPAFLDVASIYWDYYQWDDAIRTINDLRRVSGNQTSYAYQMGALYEGKTQWDKAIAEYVSTLGDADNDQSSLLRDLNNCRRAVILEM